MAGNNMPFKVLVCGGRRYSDWPKFCEVLNDYHDRKNITHIIEGGADGADRYAYRYAIINGIQSVQCVANWGHHGDAAGPVRNRAMLDLGPDLVIAFPGGKGTANMVRISKTLGIPVLEVPVCLKE